MADPVIELAPPGPPAPPIDYPGPTVETPAAGPVVELAPSGPRQQPIPYSSPTVETPVEDPFADLIPDAIKAPAADYGPFEDLVAPTEAPLSAAAAKGPNQLIGGGTADAPAFQMVNGRMSDVPKGVAVSTTDYGPFSDLAGSGHEAPIDVTSEQFGIFGDLVPRMAPQSDVAAEEAIAAIQTMRSSVGILTQALNEKWDDGTPLISSPAAMDLADSKVAGRTLATFAPAAYDKLKQFTDYVAPGVLDQLKDSVGQFQIPEKFAREVIDNLPGAEMNKVMPLLPKHIDEGLSQTMASQIHELTSPENMFILGGLALVPQAGAARIFHKAISLGFGAQAAYGMTNSIKEAIGEQDPTKFWKLVGDAVVQGGISTLATTHGFKKLPEAERITRPSEMRPAQSTREPGFIVGDRFYSPAEAASILREPEKLTPARLAEMQAKEKAVKPSEESLLQRGQRAIAEAQEPTARAIYERSQANAIQEPSATGEVPPVSIGREDVAGDTGAVGVGDTEAKTTGATETEKGAAEIKETFSDMGKAITDNFYDQAFEALQQGKDNIAGVKDPVLAKAKPLFDAGKIKSPDDLRRAMAGEAAGVRYEGFQDYEGAYPNEAQYTIIDGGPADGATFGVPEGTDEAGIRKRAAEKTAEFSKGAVAEEDTTSPVEFVKPEPTEPLPPPPSANPTKIRFGTQIFKGKTETEAMENARKVIAPDMDPVEFAKQARADPDFRVEDLPHKMTTREIALLKSDEADILETMRDEQRSVSLELREAVRAFGGLPSPSSKYWKEELRNLWTNPKARHLFRKTAQDMDTLRGRLQEHGFTEFELPDDVVNALEERFRTGKEHYPIDPMGAGGHVTEFGSMGASMPKEFERMGRKPIRIANEDIDAERAARGAEPLFSEARKTDEMVWDEAMARIDRSPESPEILVRDILSGDKKGTSEVEQAMLLHREITLRNEKTMEAERAVDPHSTDDLRAESRARYNWLEHELNENEQAARTSGTTWGRAGRARQLAIYDDYTHAAIETRARNVKGKPLTPKESVKIKEQADEIAKLRKQIEEQKDAASMEETENVLRNIIHEEMKQTKAAAKSGKGFIETMISARGPALDRIRAKRKEGRLLAAPGFDPATLVDEMIVGASYIAEGVKKLGDWKDKMLDTVGDYIKPHLDRLFQLSQEYHDAHSTAFKPGAGEKEGKPSPLEKAVAAAEDPNSNGLTAKMIFDLYRERVNAELEEGMSPADVGGVEGMRRKITQVTKDLEEHFPVTEREVRDLLTGYGKRRYPSKAADLTIMREAHRLGQLESAIEDAMKRKRPEKSGGQPDKPTQSVRDQLKRLKDEMAKAGIEPTGEEQLASANRARESALSNQIEDLQKQIRTGEKPRERQTVADSEKVTQLRAKRDSLREELQKLRDKDPEYMAKLHKEDLERKLASAQKKVEGIKAKLAGQTTAPKGKLASRPAHPALEKVLQEAERLRDKLEAIRKEGRDDAKVQRQLDRINDTINERLAKLSMGDLKTVRKAKMNRPFSPELEAAQQELDAVNKLMSDARKNPKRGAEAIQLDRYKSTLKRALAEARRRVKENDYAPKKPRKTKLDKEAQKLRFELSEAQKEVNRGIFKLKLQNRSGIEKFFGAGRETINTTRALLTSLDLSAVLRQGGFLSLAHPIRSLRAFPDMFKAFASEAGRHAANEEIRGRENAPLYERDGLYLHDERELSLDKMEEAYMSRVIGVLAGMKKRYGVGIPFKLVAGSERAYTTFLNRLRADSYDAMSKTLNRKATEPLTEKEGKAIANFINVATGRGDIRGLGKVAVNLNTVFFAPRYVLSRFQLLLGQPLLEGSFRTRRAIGKEYVRALIGVGTVLALGKMAGGTIETDSRSSDFGKIKFGNTRLDPLFGLQQTAVFLSRFIRGSTKNAKGEIVSLVNPPYGKDNLFDVAATFGRSKLSPATSLIFDLRLGQDVVGRPVTPKSALLSRVIPLALNDTVGAFQDQGIAKGTALGLLSMFGMGLQTYTPRTASPTTNKNKVKSYPVR